MTRRPREPERPREAPTREQLEAAHQLRDAPPGLHEDNVRRNVGNLLDSFGIECTFSYPTPGGPADLYLQRRRTVIETKARGLAGTPHAPQARDNPETPLQQLERYLLSELRNEKGMLAFEEHADRPWVGILTDGVVWHAWLYDHEREARGRQVLDGFVPSTAEDLIHRIAPLITGDPIGKPWIPPNPRPLFEPGHDELQTIYADLERANLAETRTKRDLWLDMLRTASMEPENEAARDRLFVTHSFLVALARGVVQTLAEAAFLTSLLNAPFLARAFLESRASGRDFHQNPWRAIPIPRYDATDPVHRDLARLCDRAERVASDWLSQQNRSYGQIAASARIRALLDERGIFAAIHRAATAILPDHAEIQ